MKVEGDYTCDICGDSLETNVETPIRSVIPQPRFLLGHGFENPADSIHGGEEYLYVVEPQTANRFEEPPSGPSR